MFFKWVQLFYSYAMLNKFFMNLALNLKIVFSVWNHTAEMGSRKWTAIVFTCQTTEAALEYQHGKYYILHIRSVLQTKASCKQMSDFYRRPVLAFRYCCCLHPSVSQSWVCLRDNSWPIQAKITKYMVKIPIVWGGSLDCFIVPTVLQSQPSAHILI